MKRKLSVAMVLAMVLVAIAATATAATLIWETYVVDVKKKEQSQGMYASWDIESKRSLIRSLMTMGYIQESDETRRLFDDKTGKDEQEEMADKLMMLLTGQTDPKEINADIITYSILGPESTWTAEQRVWWQQVTNRFRNTAGDIDTLVVSEQNDLPEAQAIAIAKAAILKAYELPDDALDKARPVANAYVTKERPDYRRWDIQFQIYKEGTDQYIERVYAAVVDMSGKVIADPDVGVELPEDKARKTKKLSDRTATSIFAAINSLNEKAAFRPFKAWPLELKAEFSKTIAPQVRDIVTSGDLTPLNNGEGPDLYVMAISSFTYGLPSVGDMRQENALKLAKEAVASKYSLSNSVMERYDDISVYFDITNPDISLWKFLFWPSPASYGRFNDQEQKLLRYKVEIDSKTGEVRLIEEFSVQPVGQALEYMLKLF